MYVFVLTWRGHRQIWKLGRAGGLSLQHLQRPKVREVPLEIRSSVAVPLSG